MADRLKLIKSTTTTATIYYKFLKWVHHVTYNAITKDIDIETRTARGHKVKSSKESDKHKKGKTSIVVPC